MRGPAVPRPFPFDSARSKPACSFSSSSHPPPFTAEPVHAVQAQGYSQNMRSKARASDWTKRRISSDGVA